MLTQAIDYSPNLFLARRLHRVRSKAQGARDEDRKSDVVMDAARDFTSEREVTLDYETVSHAFRRDRTGRRVVDKAHGRT